MYVLYAAVYDENSAAEIPAAKDNVAVMFCNRVDPTVDTVFETMFDPSIAICLLIKFLSLEISCSKQIIVTYYTLN
ncbi:protein of unknown function [Moritella yayanosii]|uniref:Uncharacterized protein n=1 Tax=Moritella yayanosii TaxID=69539 RepID=A0A330LT25_9GAMM|nr:protein of unknown function [Moritella yayanosii]